VHFVGVIKEVFDTEDKIKQEIMKPQINLLSIPSPKLKFVTVRKPIVSLQSSAHTVLQNF